MKKLVSLSISIILTFACLICSLSIVFGWMSNNSMTNSEGLTASTAANDIRLEYSTLDLSTNDFDDYVVLNDSFHIGLTKLKAPGDYDILKFRLTNLASNKVNISSFGFEKPNRDEEIPKVFNNEYYYLSTQIEATLISVDDITYNEYDSVGSGKMLGECDDNGFKYKSVILYDDFKELAQNESIEITIKLMFLNTKDNQNVYKHFGSYNEVSKRRISYSF